MLIIALDAVVLMALLKSFTDEEVGIGKALVVALLTSIAGGVLSFALASALGLVGALLGIVITGVLLGFAVSWLFGVVLTRSFMIAGIFMLVHIIASVGLQVLFHSV